MIVAMTEGEWKGLNNPTELTHFVKREVGTQAQRKKVCLVNASERANRGKKSSLKGMNSVSRQCFTAINYQQLGSTTVANHTDGNVYLGRPRSHYDFYFSTLTNC